MGFYHPAKMVSVYKRNRPITTYMLDKKLLQRVYVFEVIPVAKFDHFDDLVEVGGQLS